jgi:cytochrome c553
MRVRNSLLITAALALSPAALSGEGGPAWAFFFPDANPPVQAPRIGPYTLAGSSESYTQRQIDDIKNPPDWFPASHPPAPTAVIKGGEGLAFACGSCHLMSGMGHPESSSLAEYPDPYLKRQMADFRSGARTNKALGDAKQMDSVRAMAAVAKAWSEADADAAIDYFASLKAQPWVKVVESATVPKSYINAGYMRVPEPVGDTEPLGERIVELPQNLERQLLRDPNAGTIAYVPIGAVTRGKALANGGAISCATCHGSTLKGTADIPSIAGRSPLYTFRQLFFFKEGSRNGAMAAPMKAQMAGLNERDMIDLSAYLATLPP